MAKKKRPANRPCPCGSDAAYRECCQPFHKGDEPVDPARLVRARFSAFAMGDGEYVRRTAHPAHPQHSASATELGRARRTNRYRRVFVHEVAQEPSHARVLFTATVFQGGVDRSFVELSTFERVDGVWRYLEGTGAPTHPDVPTTIDAFVALTDEDRRALTNKLPSSRGRT